MFSIKQAHRQNETYRTMVISDKAGKQLAEYRLTSGQERSEIAAMRRTLKKHLTQAGSTLGNYQW